RRGAHAVRARVPPGAGAVLRRAGAQPAAPRRGGTRLAHAVRGRRDGAHDDLPRADHLARGQAARDARGGRTPRARPRAVRRCRALRRNRGTRVNVQRPVFAAALGAALLACTCTAPPRIDRPPLSFEIPAKWVAGAAVPAAPADTRPWWERFGDADTTRIVNLALAHNHDLRAAAARIEAAIAQARIAGADRWPQVAATFDAQRDRVRFVGFPFGGALTTTRYQTGLSLSWELDLWGRLEARERAALEEVAAAEADLAGAWLSLSAQAAKAWFTLVENERQLQLARATAESFRDSARRVQDRAETGLGSRLDERLALANVAAAEAEVTRWIEAHARAVRRLEVLLGSYPAGALTGAPQLPDLGPPVPAGLPADLVRRRPDVAAAERRVRAADALGAAAR